MRILAICIITLAAGWTIAATTTNSQEPRPVRMPEGFFLDGVEGVFQKSSTRPSEWTFRPLQKIVLADKREYPSGEPLALMPCGVLDQMTSLANGEPILVRLWAMATLYKHNNYLYCVYFLPLKGTPETPEQTQQPADANQPAQPAEPTQPADEDSIIPMEILKQIKANTAPDLQKFQQVAQVTGDTNLINRTGYLETYGPQEVFVPDAFGQNVDLRRFALLPGAAMETAEKEMNKTPGRQRFTVSGLVTTYKGKSYILLRRAERTYTHGNFTR